MAFGKDENSPVIRTAMNMRQQLRHGTRRPQSGGGGKGGGGGLFYRDKYYAPDDGTTDTIRLLPGHYLLPEIDDVNKDYLYDADGNVVHTESPFFKCISYYFAPRKYTFIGSEGPLGSFKGKGEPCLASDWYWYEWNKRKDTGLETPNSIRRSDNFVFSVLVQAPFYYVEQTKDGKVQTNDKGKAYMEWKMGSKTGRDQYAAAGYEKTEGRVLHWPLNFHQYNYILAYADALATNCRACSTEESIREIALVCRACGEAVVEMDTTNLSGIELAKFRNEPVTCTFCKHTGYLEDIVECTACGNPEPSTLFDYDLDITRVLDPTGKSTQKQLLIQKARGPRAISSTYGEDLRKPLDLPKIYAPFTMEQQQRILGPLPSDEPAPDNARPARTPVTGQSRGYQR